MIKLIVRQWRRRGFGVHSPFAFRYITTVIAPRRDACYYAETDLPDARSRLLYRAEIEAGGRMSVYREGEESRLKEAVTSDVLTIAALGRNISKALADAVGNKTRGVLFRGRNSAIFCRRDIPRLVIDIALP